MWIEEAMHHLGLGGKLFPFLSLTSSNFGELGWFTGGVTHSELGFLRQGFTTRSLPFIPTGGKGIGLREAFFSSLGESFERILPIISSSRISEGDKLFGSYAELVSKKRRLLGPDVFPLFHEQQYQARDFPYTRFTPDLPLTWLRGRHVLTEGEVWAPAQIVTLGFQPTEVAEPHIAYGSSGGLCVASNIADAVIHGCLEYIERDANNIRWVARVPPVRVRVGLDEALRLVEKDNHLANPWLQFDVFLWPSDIRGVCVLTTHLINHSLSWYKYWPGIGVGLDFVTALRGALGEIAQAQLFISFMRRMKSSFGRHPTFYYVHEGEPLQKVDNLFKTVVFYGYPRNLERIYHDFFDQAQVISLQEIEQFGIPLRSSEDKVLQLDRLCKIAARHHMNPIVFQLTPPEVASRITLVKVIIPELTCYYTSRFPLFGHSRYAHAPQILGAGSQNLTYEQLNFEPLPYP